MPQKKPYETRKGGGSQFRNTETFSISLEVPLYEAMEKARPKTGVRRFRSSEIAMALEFYYAFHGKLPAGYSATAGDQTLIANAKRAASVLKSLAK